MSGDTVFYVNHDNSEGVSEEDFALAQPAAELHSDESTPQDTVVSAEQSDDSAHNSRFKKRELPLPTPEVGQMSPPTPPSTGSSAQHIPHID